MAISKTYFPNGQLETISNHTNGLKSGDFENYNNQGVLTLKGTYKTITVDKKTCRRSRRRQFRLL